MATEALSRSCALDPEAARLLVDTALAVQPEVPEEIARNRANILGIDWRRAAREMSEVYPGPSGPELPDPGEEGPPGGQGRPPGPQGGPSPGPSDPRRDPPRSPGTRGGPRL